MLVPVPRKFWKSVLLGFVEPLARGPVCLVLDVYPEIGFVSPVCDETLDVFCALLPKSFDETLVRLCSSAIPVSELIGT